jgi:DNA-binding NarL/FixJ family response regulator
MRFSFLSFNTVKTLMTRLFAKLEVGSGTEAIARVNE